MTGQIVHLMTDSDQEDSFDEEFIIK